MRFGVVILPEHRWPVARQLWQEAEEIGFAHAWTYDHLAWRSLRDGPWFTAVPYLAGAALATRTIRIGTLVASPNFRHPALFAKELVALDDLSEGRLIAGIGAGGAGWDASMLGRPALTVGQRATRFEEFVRAVDLLLRDADPTVTGEHYTVNGGRSLPGCVQHPRVPFAIAATGRRGMRLAASYGDYWVTTGDPAAREPLPPPEGAGVVARQARLLDEACSAVGRDPSAVRRLVVTGPSLQPALQSRDAFADAVGRYAEVGVTDLVVHRPRPTEPYAGDPDRFGNILTDAIAAHPRT